MPGFTADTYPIVLVTSRQPVTGQPCAFDPRANKAQLSATRENGQCGENSAFLLSTTRRASSTRVCRLSRVLRRRCGRVDGRLHDQISGLDFVFSFDLHSCLRLLKRSSGWVCWSDKFSSAAKAGAVLGRSFGTLRLRSGQTLRPCPFKRRVFAAYQSWRFVRRPLIAMRPR